ncbi:MAG: hypothetical protein R3F46_14030 [bacterium]
MQSMEHPPGRIKRIAHGVGAEQLGDDRALIALGSQGLVSLPMAIAIAFGAEVPDSLHR